VASPGKLITLKLQLGPVELEEVELGVVELSGEDEGSIAAEL